MISKNEVKPIHSLLKKRLENSILSSLEIVELFKRMVPNHQTEMLCIVFLCIPDEILLEMLSSIENDDKSNDIANLILDFKKTQPGIDSVLAKELEILSETFTEGKSN